MHRDSPSPQLEQLLTESRWVRALAQRLASPGHDADDLVQDTWLAAMRCPPGSTADLRNWLATVLRNLVRQGHRRSSRRRRREDENSAGRPTAEPAAADLVERAATQRAVVDAVLTLDDPYRSAILLRYFEDLPPRDIAARQGIPVTTVHTHLTRGLEQLRRRLDLSRGSRAAWVGALLPLTPPPVLLSLLCMLTMKTKTLAIAALAIGALAVTLTNIEWRDPTPMRDGDSARTALASGDLERGSSGAAPAPHTQRVDATPAEVEALATAATPAARVARGRTVDPEGQAIAGLGVALATDMGEIADEAPRTTGDASGAFALPLPADTAGRILVDRAGWRTVMHASCGTSSVPRLALVVAAPSVELAGFVRSDTGSPLGHAQVRVVWPQDLRSRLSDISDAAAEETIEALADKDGAFTLRAARVRGALLMTTADGFVPDRRALPEVAAPGMQIVLTRHVPTAGAVQGQVVDPRGMPVAGASVALGGATVLSDDDGSFLITDSDPGTTLTAARAGHRRGVMQKPDAGWPPFVVLTLGPQPLSIRGRVRDAGGAPVADAKVWITNGTLHGGGSRPQVTEGIAAACTPMEELISRFRRGEITDPEATLRRTPTTAWPFVFTDADGAFELRGLEDRRYDLRAMAMDSLLMADAKGIDASATETTITLPSDAMFPTLAGVVVGGDGLPVAGASVHVQCDSLRLANNTMHSRAATTTTTDDAGHFHLTNVPHTRVYLRIDGEPILPIEFGREVPGGLLELSAGQTGHLRIVATRRMHVQVELSDPALADGLVILDLEGRCLPINVFAGRSRRTTDTLPLENGKSPVFVAPDTAATIVLRKAEKEVRREPLTLRSGAVNELRF